MSQHTFSTFVLGSAIGTEVVKNTLASIEREKRSKAGKKAAQTRAINRQAEQKLSVLVARFEQPKTDKDAAKRAREERRKAAKKQNGWFAKAKA